MFKKFQEKQELKKQKLRAKNFKLSQAGKEIHHGWGKMVHSGSGGLNKIDNTTLDFTGNPDGVENFHADLQKEIASQQQTKNQ